MTLLETYYNRTSIKDKDKPKKEKDKDTALDPFSIQINVSHKEENQKG